MRGSRKLSRGGGWSGGGGGVQIPTRGLTENFNMTKINNLAIPGGGGGGGGGPDPLSPPPPLDPPMIVLIRLTNAFNLQSFHFSAFFRFRQPFRMSERVYDSRGQIDRDFTKTCPCNKKRFLASNIENFQLKNFDIFYCRSKHTLWVHVKTA